MIGQIVDTPPAYSNVRSIREKLTLEDLAQEFQSKPDKFTAKALFQMHEEKEVMQGLMKYYSLDKNEAYEVFKKVVLNLGRVKKPKESSWYGFTKEGIAFNTPDLPNIPTLPLPMPKSNQEEAVYEVTNMETGDVVSEVTYFMGAYQEQGDSGYFYREWFKDESGNPKKVMRHGIYEARLV